MLQSEVKPQGFRLHFLEEYGQHPRSWNEDKGKESIIDDGCAISHIAILKTARRVNKTISSH